MENSITLKREIYCSPVQPAVSASSDVLTSEDATLYVNRNEPVKALEVYFHLLTNNPDSQTFEQLFSTLYSWKETPFFDEALQYCQQKHSEKSPLAVLILGRIYRDLLKDFANAHIYLTEAHASSNIQVKGRAANALGMLHQQSGKGIKPHFILARMYFIEGYASTDKEINGTAALNLGVLSQLGRAGLTPDGALAFYQQAYANGDAKTQARAAFNLALLCENGSCGVAKNVNHAKTYYLVACAIDTEIKVLAMRNLELLHQNGVLSLAPNFGHAYFPSFVSISPDGDTPPMTKPENATSGKTEIMVTAENNSGASENIYTATVVKTGNTHGVKRSRDGDSAQGTGGKKARVLSEG